MGKYEQEIVYLSTRLKYHSWMRMKCDQNRLAIYIPGQSVQPADNDLVPYMNSIKCSSCNHRISNVIKAFERIMYFHFCKKNAKITELNEREN
jgi:hypothetical protein